MFRASLCPSSGAYQLQQQPLVYRRNVVVAVLLAVGWFIWIDALVSQIYFGMKLYMFRTVPLSIIRSFSRYIRQWYMSYSLLTACEQEHMLLLASCQHSCVTYIIALRTVKISWWWTNKLSETCRVSSQNKFEKLANLVGFIIRTVYAVCVRF